MNKGKKLPILRLHALLEGQVNESVSRSDERLGEEMSRFVQGQQLSLSRTQENCASLGDRFDSFSKELLEQADNNACALILEAYGTYGR